MKPTRREGTRRRAALLGLGVLSVVTSIGITAQATPLSEPEIAVLCQKEDGEYRWLKEMKATRAKVLTPPSPEPPSEPPPEPTPRQPRTRPAVPTPAAPADTAKPKPAPPAPAASPLDPLITKVETNLPVVCKALNARTAVPRAPLKTVQATYLEWSASPNIPEEERATIYSQTQVRDQILFGLARGGSSRGASASLETSLLQGTEDFLAKRANEELTIFMLEVLKDRLCSNDENSPFENVCRVLKGSETLPASPSALSRAARADLRNFSRWLIRRMPKNSVTCAIDIGQAFTTAARDGQPVFDVVSNRKVLQSLMTHPKECKAALDKIEPVMKATQLARVYPSFSALRAEGSYELLVSLATVEMDSKPPVKEAAEVLRRMDSLSSLAIRSRGKQFSEAGTPRTALGVLHPLLSRITGKPDTADAITRAMAAVLRDDYPDTLVQLMALPDVQRAVNTFGDGATRAVGLTAELASADSSSEVSTILGQAALPLGSWRRKNEPRFGLTLTGMVGIHLNREDVTQRIHDNGNSLQVASGDVLGAAAFLGVDVHRGFRELRVGVFAPILDFGAMTSTRIGTDEDSVKPDKGSEVGVQQLLAPGGYIYVGWKPLNVGGGVSWVPALRQVSAGGRSEQLSVVRWGGFIAVDVSILPLL